MDAGTLQQRWFEHLSALPAPVRDDLARAATERARRYGLVVLREHGDVDIPLTLSPEVIDTGTERLRAHDAAAILLGVARTSRRLLENGADTPEARALFDRFGALERVGLQRWREAEDVTIARVDWFLDANGAHHGLELNATIPAMEAYSDAAANAWIETIGEAAGLDPDAIARLVERNGSNAEELRRSVIAHSPHLDAPTPPSIAIIHRPNDSQVRELEALARAFRARGHVVTLATPERVRVDADGAVTVDGRAHDILYRHIFARRMDPASDLARVARGEAKQRLQNPVNGQLEVKGVFAELSRLLEEEDGAGLDLDGPMRTALARVLPWTRLVRPGPVRDPDGRAQADLVAWVEANPERLVLKRSWDYGGKSVHLGREIVAAEGLGRWKQHVRAALEEGPAAYVVQQRIDAPKRPHLVVTPEGARSEDVFVDASTYTASGTRDVPGGGVVRFARVGIVNIVGGGGVSPLVRSNVAAELLAAFASAHDA